MASDSAIMSEPIEGTKLEQQQKKIQTKKGNDKMWQTIFNTCFTSKAPDDEVSDMWIQFKEQNMKREDISEVFEMNCLGGETKEAFNKVYQRTSTMAELMKELNNESWMDDEVWKSLFMTIRDKKVKILDQTKTISVVEGGEEKEMNMDTIEKKFEQEYNSLETSQQSIPESLIHKDHIDSYLSNDKLLEQLKKRYDEETEQLTKNLTKDNPKMDENMRRKQAQNQALDEVKKSHDANQLDRRQALYAEHKVQEAIRRAAETFAVPVTVLSGVKSYEDIGQFLEQLGITFSPLKSLKKVDRKSSKECESDCMMIALTATGPVTALVEVKRNEAEIPWDPKPEDQKIDPRNYNNAMDQLERDALRVMEILPDVKMGDVKVVLKVAFPMAQKSDSTDALTEEMFREENQEKLLNALGVSIPTGDQKPTGEMVETYKKIVCRYIGLHSRVESKTTSSCFRDGLSTLWLATRGTETSMKSQVEGIPDHREQLSPDIKKAISNDFLMRKVKSAKEDGNFAKKFLKENPGTPLKDIKLDKNRFMVHIPSNKVPIIGKALVAEVISIADDQTFHQGSDKILALIKEKYIFFDDIGAQLQAEEEIDRKMCSDCTKVKEIKTLSEELKDGLHVIPKEHVTKVLEYADTKHQGFHEALRRISSWCDFGKSYDDMQSQIHDYIASCAHCGSRTAQLLLSPQQRNALGRRHSLKFIYGKHGTGKTVVARLLCQQEVNLFGKQRIYYICFDKKRQGNDLKANFKEDLNSDNNTEIILLDRAECCLRFGVEDDNDNIKMMKAILEKVESNSVVVFDETPLSSNTERKSYSWHRLVNTRVDDDVLVIVCLQPILCSSTDTMLSKECPIEGPASADVIELTNQYRCSKKLLNLYSQLYGLPIEFAKTDSRPSHEVEGPDITVVHVTEKTNTEEIRSWTDHQIESLGCGAENLKIIYAKESKKLLNNIFSASKWENSFVSIDDFFGCETPVAVVILPKCEENSQLLEMITRTQFKLFLLVENQHKLINNLEDIRGITKVTDKELRSTHVDNLNNFQQMVIEGNYAKVKEAIQFRPPSLLNTVTGEDDHTTRATPLFLAARAGDLPMVELLTENGADVTIAATLRQGGQQTPLEAAATGGHVGVVQLLKQIQKFWTIRTLRISSTGPASTHQSSRIGEYRRIGEERSRRPVWRHQGGQGYFYYGSNNYWMVGDDYTKDSRGIQSEKAGLATIPEYGWRYRDGEDWPSDPQLRVEGLTLDEWRTEQELDHSRKISQFMAIIVVVIATILGVTQYQWRAEQIQRLKTIQTLRISSTGPASTHQSSRMGEYTRIEDEWNGRPVWWHQGGQDYFYYNSSNYWKVGPDYTKDSGGITSGEAGLATIPEYGWRYDEDETWTWTSDPQLRVEGLTLEVVATEKAVAEKAAEENSFQLSKMKEQQQALIEEKMTEMIRDHQRKILEMKEQRLKREKAEQERLQATQTLRISSTGPASTHQSSRMGEYTRIEEERNGRPVWRSKGWFLTTYFYYNRDNRWMAGSDRGWKKKGWIQSGEAGLATIPEYGWGYGDGDHEWTSDPQLRVEGLTLEVVATEKAVAEKAAADKAAEENISLM